MTKIKNPVSGIISRVEKIKRELMVRKFCIKEARGKKKKFTIDKNYIESRSKGPYIFIWNLIRRKQMGQ